MSAPPTSFDANGIRAFLSQKQWPNGLQEALIQSCEKFPVRFFVVDNSGSMMMNDGHYKVSDGIHTKLISCSRWTELTDALRFHAQVAEAGHMMCEFRLLNTIPPLLLGQHDGGANHQALLRAFEGSPGGGTPLCHHINEVIAQIRVMEPHLRANGQRAVVVIATDGESTDGNIAAAMKPLETLPVWVVIRLCTDDDAVVSYWNNIDGQLELEMDVLDDLVGEAKEVYEHNSWLTYGEPLHRLREWGVHMREMDLIDEGALSTEHMRSVCAMILFGSAKELPQPHLNWKAFIDLVAAGNRSQGKTFDPVSKTMKEWISVKRLKKYDESASSCLLM